MTKPCEHGSWVYETTGDYTRCAETGYSNADEVWRCGLCGERFDADEMQHLAALAESRK